MMFSKQTRAALMAGAAISLISSLASAEEWRLVDVTGAVRISIPGASPSAGRQNQTLPTGTTVTTAAGGRATLDNGEQRIVVASNSRLTVQPDAGGFTRIAQELGAAMFKVDKKAAPHFRVDTPLLAAIVKGTTFTVMVEGASDAVSVAEGLVEVRSNLNASVGSDVAAGATGTVMRDSPSAVQVVTPASAPAGAAPAPVNIAPIDYKAASDGLIDIAPPVAHAGQDAAIVRAEASGPSNSAVGASVLDSPAVATGGSIGVAVSQVASFEAAQRENASQIALASVTAAGNGGPLAGDSGAGNANGGSGNGGSGNGGSENRPGGRGPDAATGSGATVIASNGNSGNSGADSGNVGRGPPSGGPAGNGGPGGAGAANADNRPGPGNGNGGPGQAGPGNGNGGPGSDNGNGPGHGNGGPGGGGAPNANNGPGPGPANGNGGAGPAGAGNGGPGPGNGPGNGNGNGNAGPGGPGQASGGNETGPGRGNGNSGPDAPGPVSGHNGPGNGNGNDAPGKGEGNNGNGNGHSGNGNSGPGNENGGDDKGRGRGRD